MKTNTYQHIFRYFYCLVLNINNNSSWSCLLLWPPVILILVLLGLLFGLPLRLFVSSISSFAVRTR